MSDAVIQVENLGKRYRIRHETNGAGFATLRDVLSAQAKRLFQTNHADGRERKSVEDFWALKDVSFEVNRGEVIGIIGRNGAGKSTLLKVLSRIIEPTEGRIRIKGRVASLLEVGTGFHPELTGRENIFLNGAILGMRKAEITKKFDEIVAFAEIEKFLDTPVKRYSSGMYVRLAFAVAAHLEPEILIVDEVLAVGDAQFQKKCLGKMQDVASSQGRTVLFVSHNMQAVQGLCEQAMLISQGRLETRGQVSRVVGQYLAQNCSSAGEKSWSDSNAPGSDDLRLLAVRVYSNGGLVTGPASNRRDLMIELDFLAQTNNRGLCVGFDLTNGEGVTVLRTYQTDQSPEQWPAISPGANRWRCIIPGGLLNAGNYFVCPRIGIHNVNWIVKLDSVLEFEMLLDHGVSPLWNSLNGTNRPGLVAPILNWKSANGFHDSKKEPCL